MLQPCRRANFSTVPAFISLFFGLGICGRRTPIAPLSCINLIESFGESEYWKPSGAGSVKFALSKPFAVISQLRSISRNHFECFHLTGSTTYRERIDLFGTFPQTA